MRRRASSSGLRFVSAKIEKASAADAKDIPGCESRSPSSALSPTFFGGEGSPTKIDCRNKGTLVLTSLLEDLVVRSGAILWMEKVNAHCFRVSSTECEASNLRAAAQCRRPALCFDTFLFGCMAMHVLKTEKRPKRNLLRSYL